MEFPTICLVGATGAVGEQVLRLLQERHFPAREIRCFASSRSKMRLLEPGCFDGASLAFFCAGSSVSKQWIPEARASGCFVIDSSSAFRNEVPLIIPEINAHALKPELGIASSPNCAATMLLMPLFSLHRRFKVKRIIASTYQAASGGGATLLHRLLEETRAHLNGNPLPPLPYAFNLYPHNSSLQPNGYVEEELKMIQETRKILEDETIRMSTTCVRVPVLRAHSISANVEFEKPFQIEEIYETLADVPGLKIFENRAENRFPTPVDVTGKNEVYCGRFRIDPSQPNTLEFWSVGDQLLKGAALNAVQIGELLIKVEERAL